MNLIIENPLELSAYTSETINESTNKPEKSYFIQGIFSTIGKVNKNGRVYPRHIWEKEIEKYQQHITNKTNNSLCEWEHPPRAYVDPMKAVARIIELKIQGDSVVGKAKILNNNSPETNQLKSLINEGFKIGVSSRGVGKVNSSGVVESFNLVCYDIVGNPSDFNANLDGIKESMVFESGMCKNVDFFINENGNIEQKILTNAESYLLCNSLLKTIQDL